MENQIGEMKDGMDATMKFLCKGIFISVLCCALLGCGGVRQTVEQEPPQEMLPLRLEMTQEQYALPVEQITWHAFNETGEDYNILLIPRLEQAQVDGSWKEISCGGVFCGTADPLQDGMEGAINTEWYSGLTAGTYRLTYQVWRTGAQNKEIIYDAFVIV